MSVVKIVASESTGVQRAARDVAIGLGILVDELCPEEAGPVGCGRLSDTHGPSERERIRGNLIASDATLILYDKAGIACSPGTMFAQQCAVEQCHPALVVHIGDYLSLERATGWLASLPAVLTLNIAGPRSDEAPGIYEASYYFLEELLGRRLRSTPAVGIEGLE